MFNLFSSEKAKQYIKWEKDQDTIYNAMQTEHAKAIFNAYIDEALAVLAKEQIRDIELTKGASIRQRNR